ncbi:MAG: tRNA (adenosine(37)-N6)-dimethylallyltransferase MiaA [Clostridiales Family XIII bacterium]|jgi:tRNA dimethylallyltransferase|nr:tRNA (adenosine(37)-N6)-dimethylallyltransferase MiaA [Clostridiales Family XIII bacterium]
MSGTKTIVVVGPTAVGKTRCAIEIAREFGGEIISADSMQIYKGLTIGSAKPDAAERAAAVHHLIDFADPAGDFSVAEYQKMARETLADVAGRGRLPVVAGGTGLYVNAILYDMDFSFLPKQAAVRERLAREASEYGSGRLHEKLRALDESAAERIHPNNLKKIIRALEILESGEGREGQTAGRLRPFSESFTPWPGCDPCVFGLTTDRGRLYARIGRRVDRLMEAGLPEEVQGLLEAGLSDAHISMKGIGYKELLAHLRGECTLDEAAERIKMNSRRYAKRQLTWFKRYPGIRWFDLTPAGEAPEESEEALQDIFTHIRGNLG